MLSCTFTSDIFSYITKHVKKPIAFVLQCFNLITSIIHISVDNDVRHGVQTIQFFSYSLLHYNSNFTLLQGTDLYYCFSFR